MTGTCYNFEMEEFFSSFLRRAGMPASAGLSCYMLWCHHGVSSAATAAQRIDDARDVPRIQSTVGQDRHLCCRSH